MYFVLKVAILTGFPCLMDYNPSTETDGPPGAFAIARALIALGKRVYILTDEVYSTITINSSKVLTLFSNSR